LGPLFYIYKIKGKRGQELIIDIFNSYGSALRSQSLTFDISDQVVGLEKIRPAAPEESDAGGAASLPFGFDGRCRPARA